MEFNYKHVLVKTQKALSDYFPRVACFLGGISQKGKARSCERLQEDFLGLRIAEEAVQAGIRSGEIPAREGAMAETLLEWSMLRAHFSGRWHKTLPQQERLWRRISKDLQKVEELEDKLQAWEDQLKKEVY